MATSSGASVPPKLPPANPDEILGALRLLFKDGDTLEIRALGAVLYKERTGTKYGYFNDLETAAYAAAAISDRGAKGVYVTLNPVNEALIARTNNKIKTAGKDTSLTTDKDTARRAWLPIDIDVERGSGISASEKERAAARKIGRSVWEYLQAEGFPDPIMADSGNGVHLLYKIDLAVDDDTVARVLNVLSFLFDEKKVSVDRKVYNPSRIWKLYGTAARKGESTRDRPHRYARVGYVPADVKKVTKKLLLQIADRIPPEAKKQPGQRANTADLRKWIHKHQLKIGDAQPWRDKGKKWLFDECPFDEMHMDKAAYIVQYTAGGIAAGCHHSSCTWNWEDLQEKYGTCGRKKKKTEIQVTPPTMDKPGCSDTGNALRLIKQHGQDLRYISRWGKWLIYNGVRWKEDETQRIMEMAGQTIASIYGEAATATDSQEVDALLKHAKKSLSAVARRNMVMLAASTEQAALVADELDANPWKLNVINGTVNLKTGKLEDHDRNDLLTKLAPVEYDKDAKCPTWDAFLNQIMQGKTELIDFLYRFLGYSLTGDVSEQVLAFLYGTGSNGKTTFLNTIQSIMGDYAKQAPPELLLSAKNKHPTGVADLMGTRFVSSSEVDKGRSFAESLVKQLTGGDRIRARRMRQDFFEFDPTHKLWIAANYRPIIKGNDDAIWRRIHLVPFTVTIPAGKRDGHLPLKLMKEASGILNRLIEGCMAWQQDGLKPTNEVVTATEDYRHTMDVMRDFFDDCCTQKEGLWVTKEAFFESYCEWCEARGKRKPDWDHLAALMVERDFDPNSVGKIRMPDGKRKSIRIWKGVSLTREMRTHVKKEVGVVITPEAWGE